MTENFKPYVTVLWNELTLPCRECGDPSDCMYRYDKQISSTALYCMSCAIDLGLVEKRRKKVFPHDWEYVPTREYRRGE